MPLPAGPRRGGFDDLIWVVVAGGLLGLLEAMYHAVLPAPPAGMPGHAGPGFVAYVALMASCLFLPALLAALATFYLPARLAHWCVWFAAFVPTGFVVLDHVIHERGVPGFGVQQGGASHFARVLLVAAFLATVGALVASRLAQARLRQWLRRWPMIKPVPLGLLAGVVALLLASWQFSEVPLRSDAGSDTNMGAGSDMAVGASDSRPNILLLTIDTLRRDAVGAYAAGDGASDTPNLDTLFSQGIVADGWAPSPWTLPSMAALFSGVSATGSGARFNHALHEDIDWWPQRLQEAGYVTQAVVCNPHMVRRFGFGRGFDRFEHAAELERFEPVAQSFVLRWLQRQLVGRAHMNRGDRIVNRALNWLADVEAQSAPWFLWVHLIDPHMPYHLRGEDGALKPQQDPPWLAQVEEDLDAQRRFTDLWGARDSTSVTTPVARAALHEMYRSEVRYTDYQVGRLLSAVGEFERPLLWVTTSDHGEEFWDHGGFEHGHSMHDELLRVPLAMGGPGFPAGQEVGAMRLQDVGPTLLSALGLAMEPSRGSGLTEDDAALMPYVLGRDLRSDWPAPARCQPPRLLAEGMLYGADRVRLIEPSGANFLWSEGAIQARNSCAADSSSWHELSDHDRDPQLWMNLELWRGRNQPRARRLELDSTQEEQLKAIGYVDG